jgi:hypothetical protein
MRRSFSGNDPFAREADLRKQFELNQLQFVLIELDTGATFCGVAKSSSAPEKVNRNIKNARTAYDTALRFAREVNFDSKSKSEFDAKLDQLKSLLVSLGEHP